MTWLSLYSSSLWRHHSAAEMSAPQLQHPAETKAQRLLSFITLHFGWDSQLLCASWEFEAEPTQHSAHHKVTPRGADVFPTATFCSAQLRGGRLWLPVPSVTTCAPPSPSQRPRDQQINTSISFPIGNNILTVVKSNYLQILPSHTNRHRQHAPESRINAEVGFATLFGLVF